MDIQKRLQKKVDEYKEDIIKDKDFGSISNIAIGLAARNPAFLAVFAEVSALMVYAYCVGRERGRKENIMQAFVSAESEEN